MSRYKAYAEYKNSGVEWLGNIPLDWHSTKVKFGYEITLGKMLQKEQKEYTQILRPYLKAINIQNDGVQVDAVESMWFSPAEIQTLRLKRGDVLISEGGDVGRAAIWNDELPECYIQNAINRAQPKLNRSGKFLFYWLSMLKSSDFIDILCNKATIAHYTVDKLECSPIFLPPISDADRIANFLDHETTKIDTLIAKQQELIKLLKEKWQAVISHAVTKGLNPNAPMRDSGVEWLGKVPEHWVVAGFKKYLNSIVDYRGKTPEKHDSGIFLVTARNIKNGKINYESSQEYISAADYGSVMCRGKPRIGDLLFTTEAPLGEVASVDRDDIALAQRIIKFDGHLHVLNNGYLKYLIMSDQFQQSLMMFSSGSTALGIKVERFVYLRSLIPPLTEQLQIVTHIEMMTEKVDNLISRASYAIEVMQERRTAIISAAVTGKIDVRDWQVPSETALAAREPLIKPSCHQRTSL